MPVDRVDALAGGGQHARSIQEGIIGEAHRARIPEDDRVGKFLPDGVNVVQQRLLARCALGLQLFQAHLAELLGDGIGVDGLERLQIADARLHIGAVFGPFLPAAAAQKQRCQQRTHQQQPCPLFHLRTPSVSLSEPHHIMPSGGTQGVMSTIFFKNPEPPP